MAVVLGVGLYTAMTCGYEAEIADILTETSGTLMAALTVTSDRELRKRVIKALRLVRQESTRHAD